MKQHQNIEVYFARYALYRNRLEFKLSVYPKILERIHNQAVRLIPHYC